MLEDTFGPYSKSLETLAHLMAKDENVNQYPYCPTIPEGVDTLQCSNYTDSWGGRRYYNEACPKVRPRGSLSDRAAGSESGLGTWTCAL